jgi:hypothetical protein
MRQLFLFALVAFLAGTACWNPFASREPHHKDPTQAAWEALERDKFPSLTPAQHDAIVRMVGHNAEVKVFEVASVVSSTTLTLKDGRLLQLPYVRPCTDAKAEALAKAYLEKIVASQGVMMTMPGRWDYESTKEVVKAQVMVTMGSNGVSIGDLGLKLLSEGLVEFDPSEHGKLASTFQSKADQVKKTHSVCVR